MERVIFIMFLIVVAILPGAIATEAKKINGTTGGKKEASAMPHKHKKAGDYESYSERTHNTGSGAMPHKHETKHYTSMSDASKLPKDYILLNGEPVKVSGLEEK